MLTRLLHACGLYLGEKSELMPPQADNPEGFWEHLGFVALNDELLNELGGAWDLPPKPDENFSDPRFAPLGMKARLLIERFESTHIWGWKDPRNSLTLPFWQDLLPALKILIVVRNPLEAAHSMRERNGTSHSFGLRLWEIYNRRLLDTASARERLITDYDSFFKNPEAELRRIARFAGLPDNKVDSAAALVSARRRHTHFTIDTLIDAGVSAEIIELYRALIAEASGGNKVQMAKAASTRRAKSDDAGVLPGSVSRVKGFVPERIAQIEHLYRELLEQAEARHKEQVEELANHLAQTEARHKEQVARTQVRYDSEIEQLRDRIMRMTELLRDKNIRLAESQAWGEDLRDRLRQQLKTAKRLCRLLDEADQAASRLRSSARWQIANPFAALKARRFPEQSRRLLGYGHLEKVLSTYHKLRSAHSELAAIDDQIQALFSGKNAAPALYSTMDATESASPFAPSNATRPIEFPVQERVEISIIIPVFNQFRFTQACLASLQEHTGTERFEVIVVDDCSTDETGESIPQMPGVVYLRNETNSGFIVSCNRGAEKAHGKYLVFLNNDTLVRLGWLTALLDTFTDQSRAGIVGSKLLYPDGRLQEAGAIIWQDASGCNYGKFDDPQKPEYNYLREVDYCSAAALMIPKALFDSVGGFDLRYAPGYYEDTDLAFKVRQAGYKVLYQPLSEVVHYEGTTGGTDVSTGVKKHQEINRSTFAKAWSNELQKRPINGDMSFLRRPRNSSGKNILVIDHHLPMPDKDAGSVRMFHILKLLHELGHRVTFIPDNLANLPPYTGELQKRGIEVIYHPYIKKVRDYLVSHGSELDAVVLSRCDFARKHIADTRRHAPQSRIIFDTVDLHFVRTDREAQITSDPKTREKARQKEELEYDLIDQADETWVVSGAEQTLIREARPHKSIEIVPTIAEIPGSKTPFSLRRDWLFIGGFQHAPNIDAVVFFAQEIYPLVSKQLPDAKFYIIGDKAPPEIVALATDRIIIAGWQKDVRPFFDSAKLSVAPLRFGAGIKGKINQSMGFGVPVVATSLAVEGMGLSDREDILIADRPEDFAQALVELYQSEKLWSRLSENGVRKTHAFYSPEAVCQKLEFLFSDEHLKSLRRSPTVAEEELVLAATT